VTVERRKRKSGRGERGAKRKRNGGGNPKSVDEYFAGVAEPAWGALREMREAIRSVVPAEATEVISYRIPAFRHVRVLVWYAAFAEHCSLFPTAAVIDEFKEELKAYTVSKGTIQFPLGKPLPVGLIKRIVRARVAMAGRGK
jgi:uncharacterized protein YdhG (YjbR/CyaY superfamily)